MPPPNKQFYSYLGQQQQQQHRRGGGQREEDQDDDSGPFSPEEGAGAAGSDATSVYMQEAQRLKHEADRETDRERQAMKYLQAVLYFSLNANYHEQSGDKSSAFTIYRETLNLIK